MKIITLLCSSVFLLSPATLLAEDIVKEKVEQSEAAQEKTEISLVTYSGGG